jgi:segregation and condensation protein B
MLEEKQLQQIIEGILLAAGKALTEAQLLELFAETERPTLNVLRQVLFNIEQSCQNRGFTLVQIASGYQFQVKQDCVKWVAKLWEEKPAKYSKAFFETLAIIAYRQPVTKGEIEDIRGVSISPTTFKILDEKNWIRIVGHKNVPGKPALYATTKQFLDYFGLKSLDALPSLPEIMQLGEGKNLELNLNLDMVAEEELTVTHVMKEEGEMAVH